MKKTMTMRMVISPQFCIQPSMDSDGIQEGNYPIAWGQSGNLPTLGAPPHSARGWVGVGWRISRDPYGAKRWGEVQSRSDYVGNAGSEPSHPARWETLIPFGTSSG
jgi:hypothetical protein